MSRCRTDAYLRVRTAVQLLDNQLYLMGFEIDLIPEGGVSLRRTVQGLELSLDLMDPLFALPDADLDIVHLSKVEDQIGRPGIGPARKSALGAVDVALQGD